MLCAARLMLSAPGVRDPSGRFVAPAGDYRKNYRNRRGEISRRGWTRMLIAHHVKDPALGADA